MSHAIDCVEGKRETQTKLDGALDGKRQRGESLDQAGALDVPSEQRGGEVGCEVGVGSAGQGDAGDTGPCGRAEPGLFDFVDGQMGGDGAAFALVDEDLVAFIGG